MYITLSGRAGAALALLAGGASPARSQMHMQHPMSMTKGPLGIPETRQGSGTAWLPDASPMHASHLTLGAWTLMLHGSASLMYDWQSGPRDTTQALGGERGGAQVAMLDWFMVAANRPFIGGQLHLRGMFSTDPYEVTGAGYPELLQTGEFYKGVHIHDRQHPHNLFMELAALYEVAIGNKVGVSLYVAPAGEPAVGPVAFMHRPSSENDPFAPISHHWQDATHITFGVLTAGLFTRTAKLEASWFNGREPDQNRSNLEYRNPDSYSARVTVNPGSRWSVSAWYAYLNRPEAGFLPNVRKYGMSVLTTQSWGKSGHWASALIWGANSPILYETGSSGFLFESNLDLDGVNAVFARAEYVKKQAHDIIPLVPGVPTRTLYALSALAVGYHRVILTPGRLNVGLGVRAAVNFVPAALESFYNSKTPVGSAFYLTLRPGNAPAGDMMDMPGMSH
jgi:hypothetical protein